MQSKFCSTCKHSKYVTMRAVRKLLCRQREAFGLNPYINTDCTDAEECLDFDPENWRDDLTTRPNYAHIMKKCGIPLEDEKKGVLALETLT